MCPKMKLTQSLVDALELPVRKAEHTVWDDAITGLGIRLRGDTGTWFFRYRFGQQHRRITLGATGALSASAARKLAADLYAKVAAGQDPAGERHEQRARGGETVGALLDPYLAFKAKDLRPRSLKEITRHLRVNAKALHSIHIARLDRRAISTCRTAIAAKRGEVTANRTLASLSAFATWCMQEGLVDANPVLKTARYVEKTRERVLSDAELAAIWEGTAGGADYDAIVRLLMLTGCRISEIGGLRWDEIVDNSIILPPARTKNGRPHTIALAPAAQAVLDARLRNDDPFVFGYRKGRPFSGWTKSKRALDQRISENGVKFAKSWTPHDLRRTFATRLSDAGVPPHVIDELLNHVSGHKHGVRGIYNRSSYLNERRDALLLWADVLMGIVGEQPAKVVPLQRV
jgi:integrase